ncbi:hypothetical protein PIB30_073463 [Stylosanthes scabra]|uniref:Uncharacterized protein n=1 Tax=Stylosanthes scabra TaxID=79078 RepID=A0ABU6TP10_9FABA|nr:hypothetical protein [Stylosanthes scabra]
MTLSCRSTLRCQRVAASLPGAIADSPPCSRAFCLAAEPSAAEKGRRHNIQPSASLTRPLCFSLIALPSGLPPEPHQLSKSRQGLRRLAG